MSVPLIRRESAVLATLAALALAGMAPSASAAPLTLQAGASSPDSAVVGNGFYPRVVTTVQGETLTWVFDGAHTVTFGAPPSPDPTAPAGNGTWTGGADSESSGIQFFGTYTLTFDTPGTYPYVSSIQPGMQGIVSVLPSGTQDTQAQVDARATAQRTADLTAGLQAQQAAADGVAPLTVAAGTAPPSLVNVPLMDPTDPSAPVGSAVIRAVGQSVHTELTMSGLQTTETYPAHIHRGQCANPIGLANIIYPFPDLVPDSSGNAALSSDFVMTEPAIPQAGWYLNVHEPDSSTVCGDISPQRGSGMRFVPGNIEVSAGQTVTWRQPDPQEVHMVSFGTPPADPFAPASGGPVHAGAGDFHSGPLAPGQAYSLTFQQPGTYPYVCGLHEALGMTGSVVVKPGGGSGAAAFGADTLVTLRLAAKAIRARGPLKIAVTNGNEFQVSGELSGRTARPVAAAPRRRINLKSRSFTVPAKGKATVRLKLPRKLSRVLRRKGRLKLRLRASVRDPSGNTRTVAKTVSPKLKRKRPRRR